MGVARHPRLVAVGIGFPLPNWATGLDRVDDELAGPESLSAMRRGRPHAYRHVSWAEYPDAMEATGIGEPEAPDAVPHDAPPLALGQLRVR